MSNFPSLAEVLAAHQWRGDILGCGCRWNWPDERSYFCGEDERIAEAHTEHQADAWREACTIRTVEQLHAGHLTAWGTLIAEIHTPDDDCPESNCWIVPVVWEMVNQMGWMCHNDRPADAEPRLPALLIWRPDWTRP